MNRLLSCKSNRRVPLYLCLAAFSLSAQNGALTVRDAWVRVPAPSKLDTAMYMVIENHTAQARSVVSISTTAAEKAEMHEMKFVESHENGSGMPGATAKEGKHTMMMMSPVAKISIPPMGKAVLAPGGLHVMVFGLRSKVGEGDRMPFRLKLDDGTTIPVTATVRK